MSQIFDIQFLSETLSANYATMAFVMVLLYDYALTFEEEVEFIWQQKMNLGNILFILLSDIWFVFTLPLSHAGDQNRYIPMIDLVIILNSYTNRGVQQDKFCLPWFHIDVWIRVLCSWVINMLLLLRTWAIWGRSRAVLICLSVLLVVCMLAASGLSLYASLTGAEIPSLNSIRPCLYAIPNTNVLYATLVSCIVFDSTVLILTLVKIVPAWQPGGVTPLITQLLKDGIQYFVMIFLIAIANIIVIHVAPPALAATLSILYTLAASILGCRLILNLHGSILRSTYNEEDTTIELNTLVFNNCPNSQTIAMHEYQ